MANAIYQALRTSRAADHFPINRIRRYDNQAYFTDLAFNEAKKKGAIYSITREGIVMAGGRVFDSPRIRVRNTKHDPITLTISNAEGRAISEYFELARKIWNDAFFETPGGRSAILPALMVKPIWAELLTPRYAAAFRLWLAGKGPMPNPRLIPWQTRPGGFISMPTIGLVMQINEAGRQVQAGKLILEENHGSRYGIFRFADETKRYALRPDGFELVGNRQIKVTFDRFKFRELFLPWAKTSREYSCSQKLVGDNLVNLGTIEGETFTLQFSKASKVERGRIYHFHFTREPELLRIEAFSDASRQKPIGRRTVQLNPEGFPYNTNLRFMLEAPGN